MENDVDMNVEKELIEKQRQLEAKEKELNEKEKKLNSLESKVLNMKYGLYDRIDVSLKTMDKVIFFIIAALVVALIAAFILR